MTTFEQLKSLQQSIYEGNAKKGFWDDGPNRNKEEACMLMITELSEAVESHRKHQSANHVFGNYDTWFEHHQQVIEKAHLNTGQAWKEWFEDAIKDTIEDEIADTIIRLLDTTYGFEWDLQPYNYTKESKGNFAGDVFRLTAYIIKAFHSTLPDDPEIKNWGHCLSAIIKFCEWYSIDIVQHVEWKLKYNATRPPKHGKAY